MKRLVAAVSFAVLAVPAVAQVGLPYDQNLVDRALPNISVEVNEARSSRFGAPYDQNLVDRALPNIQERRTTLAASSGNTRSDVEISTEAADVSTGSLWATGPWANDPHFIAPAQ